MLATLLDKIPVALWRALAWLGLGVVLWVCLIRVPSGLDLPHVDKLVHLSMYASLMLCFSRGYRRHLWPRIAVALAFYGLTIEYLQSLTPYRSASLADEVANVLGISIMLWLVWRAPVAAPSTAPRTP